MFRRLLLTAFAFFLAMPFSVSAQETVAPVEPPAFLKDVRSKADFDRLTPEQQQEANAFIKGYSAGPSLAGQTVAPLSGTANCFDYYAFGSVQVDLSPALEQTFPGIPMTFTGELKNQNPYPIVNGSVYVKIFKLDGLDEEETHRNGHPLVAFFEAGENIQIPASGTVPFTFEWQVPSALSGGDYEAAYFFVTNDRFNLLGLSFTDDVTGNKATFRVTDTNNQQVVFDKNTVTLNDKPYSFAAFPPRFKPDEQVQLEATLVNPSDTEKTVTLTWKLYNWDGLRDDHLLDAVEETVTLKPKERKQLGYTAKRYTGTVSYMIVTAQDGDATSVINPRFAREGVEEVRLNFPSLFTYPFEAGKEATIFSCLHSTNLPIVENNALTMTLTDADTGEKLHEYSYEGGITSAMMGVKDVFTPTYVPRRVMLTSTLTHNGVTVDTVSETYDCAVLSPENCPKENATAAQSSVAPIKKTAIVIILAIAIAVFVAGILVYRRRHAIASNNNDTSI